MTDDLDTLERDPGDEDEAREAAEDTDEPRDNQPWAKASSGDVDSP
jgi:hypothetical protein